MIRVAQGDPVHDMPENRTPKVLNVIRLIPKDGGSRRDLPEEFQLECHKRCNGFKDVYGRMAWKKPAPTITSGCFNPFPTTENKSAVALMIGNALPPKLGEVIGLSILTQLSEGEKYQMKR